VATALLVAGFTLTFWIPPFASLKALGSSYNCRRLSYGSFQLTHMSRDDHAVQLIEPWRPKRTTTRYYSAHNFATRVSFNT